MYSLLLSIRPQHAKKIFDGVKNVELRRVKPKITEGDAVLVYASAPTKAIIGGFEVAKVIEGQPEEIWNLIGNSTGILKSEFDEYFLGTNIAFGIVIKKFWQLKEPIGLSILKTKWINFHPPQSYRYLNEKEIRILEI